MCLSGGSGVAELPGARGGAPARAVEPDVAERREGVGVYVIGASIRGPGGSRDARGSSGGGGGRGAGHGATGEWVVGGRPGEPVCPAAVAVADGVGEQEWGQEPDARSRAGGPRPASEPEQPWTPDTDAGAWQVGGKLCRLPEPGGSGLKTLYGQRRVPGSPGA